jgi:hypothetical protein
VQRHGWLGYALLVAALVAVLPAAANITDYGAEGWLWALFGFCQSRYVEGRSATEKTGLMRVLACCTAATVYVWQEQKEFSFPTIHLAVVILGVGLLSFGLCLYLRGRSWIQPPAAIASALGFIGRHTLEIYAVQLAVSELIVKLVPSLGV